MPEPQRTDTLETSTRSPRLYYGWVMVPIATLTLIATAPAQTFGISAFNASFREALGLSHSQLTGAYMLGTLLASLPMSWIGALMDRFGLRRVLTAVVLLFGGVCVATSQVAGLLSLFLAFLMLRMLGQGAMGLLSGTTLAFWFERRLGTVEGVRNFGIAAAIGIVPALNLWLIEAVGWRWAFATLGLGVLAVMGPLLLAFRNRPEEVGQPFEGGVGSSEPDRDASAVPDAGFTFAEARRTRAFWIVAGATAFWGMANTAVFFNIVPLFAERGLNEADAARLFTFFAVCLAAMQLVGGVLADRVPLNQLLAAAMAAMAGSMILFWTMASPALIPLCALCLGAAQGLLMATKSTLWPRYYGRAHLGRIRGALATVMVSSSSVGPFILGLYKDLAGSYEGCLMVFALLSVPLVGLALLATPPARHEADQTAEPELVGLPDPTA